MDLMADGREAGDGDWANTTGVDLMLPFIADASWACVDFVREERV
jgi:hypothetical protein